MRGQSRPPTPPCAVARKTGRVRLFRVVHEGQRQQVLTPGRHEVHDDDYHDTVAHQRENDPHQRAKRVRPVDLSGVGQVLWARSGKHRA